MSWPHPLLAASCMAMLLVTARAQTKDPEPSPPGEAPAPAEAAEPVLLEFGWPVPSSAVVTEEILKKGNLAREEYRITLEEEGEDRLRLSTSDFRILSFNGRPATDPALADAMAQTQAIAGMIPDLLIKRSGEPVGVDGLDELIEETLAFLSESDPEGDAEALEGTRKMMRSPQMRAGLEQVILDPWNLWVGAWTEIEIAAGEKHEFELTTSFGEMAIPTRGTLEHLGAEKDVPDTIHLRLTTVIDDPEAGRQLFAQVMAMMKEAGADPTELQAVREQVGFRRTVELDAWVEPATLRPHRARSRARSLISGPDPEDPSEITSQESLELHVYTFEW